MKFPSYALVAAACAATLIISQSCIPTVNAQDVTIPNYRIRFEWQQVKRAASGVLVRGVVTNTGSHPLVYTQVAPLLVDKTGRVVYRATGYLTVSPLVVGASAEFRAYCPSAPVFAQVKTVFREKGTLVITESPTRP